MIHRLSFVMAYFILIYIIYLFIFRSDTAKEYFRKPHVFTPLLVIFILMPYLGVTRQSDIVQLSQSPFNFGNDFVSIYFNLAFTTSMLHGFFTPFSLIGVFVMLSQNRYQTKNLLLPFIVLLYLPFAFDITYLPTFFSFLFLY